MIRGNRVWLCHCGKKKSVLTDTFGKGGVFGLRWATGAEEACDKNKGDTFYDVHDDKACWD